MKKLMVLILLAGLTSTVNANNKSQDPGCNFWITYPCPGNPITAGCFATYEEAVAYLAEHPWIYCP